MSYVQMKIGTKDIFIESKIISIPTGDPAPTPATGYSISGILYTQYGEDFYLEYKEVEGDIVLS